MSWSNAKYDGAHLFLAALYGLLGLLSCVCWVRLWRSGQPLLRWQLGFHPVLILGTMVRATAFCLQPFVMEGDVRIWNVINSFLYTFPSLLFFINYLIVLFLWAEIYHFKRGIEILRLRPLFWVLAVMMYGLYFLLYILDFALYPRSYTGEAEIRNTVEQVIQVYTAVIYLSTASAFVVYGVRISSRLRMIGNKRGKVLVLRIALLTALVAVCFFVRTAFVLLNIWDVNISWYWWVDAVYYSCLEWLPMLLMLAILHSSKKSDKPAAPPQRELVAGEVLPPDIEAASPLLHHVQYSPYH